MNRRLKRKTSSEKLIGNQQGFLTVDFMFSMVATLGCLLLLLRVSIGLMSVQIAQYVVFAAARAHAAGDLTEADQVQAGEKKYAALTRNRKLMAGFFSSSKQIQKNNVIDDFKSEYNPTINNDGTAETGLPFVGARAQLALSLLKFSVPFLGSTEEEGANSPAFVSAMIFREPSQEECRLFFKESNRYEAIIQKSSRYRNAKRQGPSHYTSMEDSGC